MGHDRPVSKLFSHATGAAALLNALLVLLEKNIPSQYIEPEYLLKLSPRGLVPALECNKPLYESTVICEFIEETYHSATPHLLAPDPYAKAPTRIWVDFVSSRIIPDSHRFLQHHSNPSTSIVSMRSELLDKLKQFTEAIDHTGP
ncbi:unnamed protein product [Diplocarpon coronariae]